MAMKVLTLKLPGLPMPSTYTPVAPAAPVKTIALHAVAADAATGAAAVAPASTAAKEQLANDQAQLASESGGAAVPPASLDGGAPGTMTPTSALDSLTPKQKMIGAAGLAIVGAAVLKSLL